MQDGLDIGRVRRLVEEEGAYLIPSRTLPISTISTGDGEEGQVPRITNGIAAWSSAATTADLEAEATTRASADSALDTRVTTAQSEIDAHEAATSGAHTASAISFAATGGISATNAQSAIVEVYDEKVTKSGDTMTGALAVQTSTVKSVVDGGVINLYNSMQGTFSQARITLSGIYFGDGTADPDVGISRVAAGVLSLDAGDVLRQNAAPSVGDDLVNKTYTDGKIEKSIVTARGQVLAGTASGTVGAIPTNTNGMVLVQRLGQPDATGVKWEYSQGTIVAMADRHDNPSVSTSAWTEILRITLPSLPAAWNCTVSAFVPHAAGPTVGSGLLIYNATTGVHMLQRNDGIAQASGNFHNPQHRFTVNANSAELLILYIKSDGTNVHRWYSNDPAVQGRIHLKATFG